MIQSVAIIVSLCMMGMTVIPSSLIPCCCKSTDCSALRVETRGKCCSAPSGAGLGQIASEKRTCCSTDPVESVSCCPSQSIKPDCPTCRCLEKMQVVALSGYSVYVSTEKTQPAFQTIAAANSLEFVQSASVRPIEVSPPGVDRLTITCALRC